MSSSYRLFCASLLVIGLLTIVGCKSVSIKFNPDFYVPSVNDQALINQDGVAVSFQDEKVEQFACLSREKVKELKEILMRNKIGKEARWRVQKEFSQLSKRMETEYRNQ